MVVFLIRRRATICLIERRELIQRIQKGGVGKKSSGGSLFGDKELCLNMLS